MVDVLIKLPFDKTGKSPTNKVSSETHTLVNRRVRAVVPEYGAFFSKSLVVRDGTTLAPLVRGTQYRPAEKYNVLSQKYGQEICAAILIVDENVGDDIVIEYQALGGEYSYSSKKIAEEYASLDSGAISVDWNDLIDKDKLFQPAPHKQELSTIYGMEYWVKILQQIKQSIIVGDGQSHKELEAFIAQLVGSSADDASVVIDVALAEHLNAPNPHAQYARVSDIGANIAPVRKPTNITPAGSATAVLPTTAFSASAYSTLYGLLQKNARFQVSTRADFATVVFDVTVNGNVTSYQPATTLSPSATYYWRVMYEDEEGAKSLWSEVTSFSTAAISIAKPATTAPAPNAETQTETPTFTSNSFTVIGGTDSHAASSWEIWTGPNGTGTLAYARYDSQTEKTSMTVPLQTLAQNTAYYARVRYKGALYGYSDWSNDLPFVSKWQPRPTTLGQAFGGGYWAGDIVLPQGTFAVIVAPKAGGDTNMALSNTNNQTSNMSNVDSVANTNALPNTAAVTWVKNLSLGGFNDWVIPAKNVMALAWTNLRPNLASAPAAFKTGGAEAFAASYYWTSTAYNWVETVYEDDIPEYGTVNHHDCTNQATERYYGGWDTGGQAPDASCSPGSVSNITYGYWSSYDPGVGQLYVDVTTHWCCDWSSYEIIGYTPGDSYNVNHYDGYAQFMGTSNSVTQYRKTTASRVRAVRLVRVA